MLNYMVVGGTGRVGALAAAKLSARGLRPTVLSRSLEVARPIEGVAYKAGDLDTPSTLAAAFAGVDRLLLITPMHPDEAARGVAAVAAARKAGVKRIVYQSCLRRPGMDDILHYRTKTPVEQAILSGGFEHSFLRPNSFHQNDNFLKGPILGGVYPQPVGNVGVSRIDIADIAHAAVVALTDDSLVAGDFELHGPDAVTGDQTAELFAAALGRPVVYGGDDLDAWTADASGYMPGWMVEALRRMYAHFQAHGMQPLAGSTASPVLPASPISTRAYVDAMSRTWSAQTA